MKAKPKKSMRVYPKKRTLIYGKTQTGKTTYNTKVILKACKNIVLYDTKWQYGGHGAICHSFAEFKELLKDGCNRIIVQPRDYTWETLDEYCDFMIKYCRNFTLIVEELQNYCTPNRMGEGLRRYITMGEEDPRNLGFVGITQQPPSINTGIKSQMSVVVCFLLPLLSDAQHVASWFDVEKIMNLPKREFYVYDDELPAGEQITHYLPINCE